LEIGLLDLLSKKMMPGRRKVYLHMLPLSYLIVSI